MNPFPLEAIFACEKWKSRSQRRDERVAVLI